MGFLESVGFWLAKAVSEFLIFLGLIVLAGIVAAIASVKEHNREVDRFNKAKGKNGL